MLAKLRDFDFYRQIPKDLTETSLHGSILSICAAVFILVLFIAEFWAFLSSDIVTNIIIDPNTDSLLRINFNITVLDMPCEYATIDVVDVLGTRSDNVTKNINKWQVDENGIRQNYEGRNPEQRELQHDTHHDPHELIRNGVHAVPVDNSNFEPWLSRHEYTMVDFYAPWCVWCQRLEPIWEAFAEAVENDPSLSLSVIKVDCVANKETCMQQKVQAFPLVRFFKNGEAQTPDYRMDRTVASFMEYARSKVAMFQQLESMTVEEKDAHHERLALQKDDHPGCMMAGFLLVNRVPGNFHIQARSKHHNLNPSMANLSHAVNHLTFGPILSKTASKRLSKIPEKYFSLDNTMPMDDHSYSTYDLHQGFHHHLKVVSTNFMVTKRQRPKDAILAYQIVHSSQVMQYNTEDIPEARFEYDLSPMSVMISRSGKHWYEFVTSMCALIGGTFTVLGLLSTGLGVLFKSKQI